MIDTVKAQEIARMTDDELLTQMQDVHINQQLVPAEDWGDLAEEYEYLKADFQRRQAQKERFI